MPSTGRAGGLKGISARYQVSLRDTLERGTEMEELAGMLVGAIGLVIFGWIVLDGLLGRPTPNPVTHGDEDGI